jgi:hypothetical protein
MWLLRQSEKAFLKFANADPGLFVESFNEAAPASELAS